MGYRLLMLVQAPVYDLTKSEHGQTQQAWVLLLALLEAFMARANHHTVTESLKSYCQLQIKDLLFSRTKIKVQKITLRPNPVLHATSDF